MTLQWTRTLAGHHNSRPLYEHNAHASGISYSIVWASDAGFGYTAIRRGTGGRNHYLSPTAAYAIGITWCRTLRRCKEECERIEARYGGQSRTLMVPDIDGFFEDFSDWVNSASRRIGESHCPLDTVGQPIRAICLDTKGRRCQVGGDFMRARDEKTFPVVYFWDFKRETV